MSLSSNSLRPSTDDEEEEEESEEDEEDEVLVFESFSIISCWKSRAEAPWISSSNTGSSSGASNLVRKGPGCVKLLLRRRGLLGV